MTIPAPHPDRTCLVTGASSGIGSEIARLLAARGLGVTVVARREGKLKDLAAELASRFGIRAETVVADSEEYSQRMGLLGDAMQGLTDRERHILTQRRLKDEPTTLEDLAGQYGVSRERVRQIEVRAFEKLQKAMKTAAVEKHYVEA